MGSHAQDATRVSVTVARENDGITIEVTDDGHSNLKKGNGFGLIGLGERLEELGGTLQSGPVTPHGWRLRAHLPPPA